MAHEEYLRRNLLHCASIGACSAIEVALIRANSIKGIPQWLIGQLEDAHVRAARLPREMAAWRDSAPDSPYAAQGDKG